LEPGYSFSWNRLLPPKAFGAVQSSTFMATDKSVAACFGEADEGSWNPGSHIYTVEAILNCFIPAMAL
jgi:hypothetical protein